MLEEVGKSIFSPLSILHSTNGLMPSPNNVRTLTSTFVGSMILIRCLLSVRWGPEASRKCRAEVIQSAFLWIQFYETQLHIHRMFALKEPPDPELSASSMIICKNAAKNCVAIMESAWDVMIGPFHCFLLIVSSRCCAVMRTLDLLYHF